MTETKQDRPAVLPARKPIRATADEGVDPVLVPPPAPPEKAPPRTRKIASAKAEAVLEIQPPTKQQPVAVFPFSTRLSQEVMDILKSITDTGVSQRAAVEHAIRMTYGQKG